MNIDIHGNNNISSEIICAYAPDLPLSPKPGPPHSLLEESFPSTGPRVQLYTGFFFIPASTYFCFSALLP